MIGDLLIAVILIIISIVLRLETSTYGDYSRFTLVGPELFPNSLSILFLILAFFLVLKPLYLLLYKKTDSDGVSYWQKEKNKVKAVCRLIFHEQSKGTLTVIGNLLLLAAYALLFKTVGFELTTIVFLFLSMLICGERRPLVLIAVPIGAVAVVYVFLVVLMRVSIPMLFLG